MSTHRWQFFVAGGVNQVRLETADDLLHLHELDPKLWVALSCPVRGHAMDERTMALIDTDNDGRVRVAEILAAVDLVLRTIRNPAEILADPVALPLSSVRDDTPEGRAVLVSAKGILASLGRAAATEIRIADLADVPGIFARMPLNGDGIVHPGATGEEDLKRLIGEIIAAVGAEKDRSGEDGVSLTKVEQFFAACTEFAAWEARGVDEKEELYPLAAGTDAAVAALVAVASKVDDYFARCRLVAFDSRRLEGAEAGDVKLDGVELSGDCREAAALPLARVVAGAPLPLTGGVNPAWADRIEALRKATIQPVLGDVPTLQEGDWVKLKARLDGASSWRATPRGASVTNLGATRIRALLEGDHKARLLALIAADEARRPEAEEVGRVDQTVRYYAHLGRLLRNFVNFSAFYGRREKAIFQAGTAYFDQRSCDLALRVEDPGRHALMAAFAGAYLVYLDCVRRSDARQMTVCVAVTDGDSDNLMVGRNGLFYDREGRDYDAHITKIVDNPISLRQAAWNPYKKFIRMVEEMVAKRAAAADAQSTASLGTAAEATAAPVPVTPPKKPIDIGTVAAIGVAVGGISAALGALLQGFFGLGMWMPVGLLGLLLLISGPSVIIAALKLRRRNLGPILDADGWAVNTQARINIPFGQSLTALAELPAGSSRDLRDPFAQKPKRWPYVVALLVIGVAAVITALILTGRAGFLMQK